MLRGGLETHSIPWTAPLTDFATDRVFAWPYPLFSPVILLSPWFSDRVIFTLYWLLGYSVGFVGAVKLFDDVWKLAVFWLVFNFNGYMVGHLLAGHIQLVGYFLIPWFLYALHSRVRLISG